MAFLAFFYNKWFEYTINRSLILMRLVYNLEMQIASFFYTDNRDQIRDHEQDNNDVITVI